MFVVECDNDECDWGPKHFHVLTLAQQQIMVHEALSGHDVTLDNATA